MPSQYTVDLSLDDCLARLDSQQKSVNLANGYTFSIVVKPVQVGTGAYRVQITRNIRGWRRGRKSSINVFLKRTGGTITQVRIQNAEQFTPMILGAVLLGFGIILGLRGLYAIAGICLLLGAVMLVIVWMLYTGQLVPRSLVEIVTQALPARNA